MKNITSSSTCSTGLLQLQNNLSCSELEVAEKTEQQAVWTRHHTITVDTSECRSSRRTWIGRHKWQHGG
uniref:Mutant scalloped n=1 Tax=Drosophila melanogaster TaxID=7227 RepID=G8CTJ8_DROME|nr:mutant scalloped [Drosophila melanogaster]